jgi:hypothetical protein
MYGKVILISSIFIAVFIGNHFSNLYIPDDYERPHFYKVQYAFIKIFTFIVRLFFKYLKESETKIKIDFYFLFCKV